MITQNIFIIGHGSLYETLDEIKEIFFFKISRFDDEEEFIKNFDLDKKNFLIISQNQNKLKINRNITDKNLLCFNNFPLPLSKILELINVKLLKLKFNYQSKVNIQNYELNLNSKFFSKNNMYLKLTEKEIEIILYLNQTKKKHNVLDLQKNIWTYSANMETHTVETHIYRLRKKISNKFNDESFLLSDKNGYFIE
jgi:hypothetical protein